MVKKQVVTSLARLIATLITVLLFVHPGHAYAAKKDGRICRNSDGSLVVKSKGKCKGGQTELKNSTELVGPAGKDGKDGAQGPQGNTGPAGAPGILNLSSCSVNQVVSNQAGGNKVRIECPGEDQFMMTYGFTVSDTDKKYLRGADLILNGAIPKGVELDMGSIDLTTAFDLTVTLICCES